MRRLLPLALAFLLLAGCADGPTARDPLAGTFELERADGRLLPTQVGTDFLGGPVVLLDGSLRLRADDFTLTYRTRALGGDGTTSIYGTAERTGATIVLTDQWTRERYTAKATDAGLTLSFAGSQLDLRRR